MDKNIFRQSILNWYNKHQRDLPWRQTRDPFKIWLSEVIMQQTRVNQGLPYYLRFDARFQNVRDLASASEEEVLQLWQGLGYYSRGRNLLYGARFILEEYDGSMPNTYKDLLSVKGIGKYTAAAIASIAYEEAVPCIDGNVYRVISRVFGVEDDLHYSAGQKKIQELCERLISEDFPGDYNQGVMEFGAIQCTPRKPDCIHCIFKENCYAFINNKQQSLPFKSKKVAKKGRFMNYVFFFHEGWVLMNKRSEKDIWQGLYDFYLLNAQDQVRDEEQVMTILKTLGENMNYMSYRDYRHVLSHQVIQARISRVEVTSKEMLVELQNKTELLQFSINELRDLPKPVLINKYLNDEIF